MNDAADALKESLEEAVSHAKGETDLPTRTSELTPEGELKVIEDALGVDIVDAGFKIPENVKTSDEYSVSGTGPTNATESKVEIMPNGSSNPKPLNRRQRRALLKRQRRVNKLVYRMQQNLAIKRKMAESKKD